MRELKMTPEAIKRREYYQKTRADPKKVERIRERHRIRYQENVEHRRAYHRKYYREHPEMYQQSAYRWAREHTGKVCAENSARRYAVKKDHCEYCNTKEGMLVMHHFDYSKPLEVVTVCKSCHRKIHHGIIKGPEIINVGQQKDITDRHCDTCGKVWPDCGRKGKSLSTHVRQCGRWIACKQRLEA